MEPEPVHIGSIIVHHTKQVFLKYIYLILNLIKMHKSTLNL